MVLKVRKRREDKNKIILKLGSLSLFQLLSSRITANMYLFCPNQDKWHKLGHLGQIVHTVVLDILSFYHIRRWERAGKD